MRTFFAFATLVAVLILCVSSSLAANSNGLARKDRQAPCSSGCGSCESCINNVCTQVTSNCPCAICDQSGAAGQWNCRFDNNQVQDTNFTCPVAVPIGGDGNFEESGGGESHKGAIIGGVIGGVVGLLLLTILGLILLALLAALIAGLLARRRRRTRTTTTRTTAVPAETTARTNPLGPGAATTNAAYPVATGHNAAAAPVGQAGTNAGHVGRGFGRVDHV